MQNNWLRSAAVVSSAGLVAGLLSVVGVVVSAAPAGAVGCPAWVNVDGAECVVNAAVSPGTPPAGGWIFAKTLHVLAGGSINAENADGSGFEGHVSGDVILDGGSPGGIIQADDTGVVAGDGTPAQPIVLTATENFSMGAGSRISADNLWKLGGGGDITIEVGKNDPGTHVMEMLGTAGSGSCRTFDGPNDAIYQYASNNTPNVYQTPSLGARISSVRYGGSGSSAGGHVSITVGNYGVPPAGVFTMERCALVDVSSLGSGGVIDITAGKEANLAGLVLSESAESGQSPHQPRGGGPINIRAGCKLTVTSTGFISSKGQDPGADLVHLKGCDVLIQGVVQSTTTAGHALPDQPPNLCNDDPVAHPNGLAAGFTACVRILGQNVTIDASGSQNGNVNVDGVRAAMRGWIDIFATQNVTILGDPAPAPKWAVSANACAVGPCSNAFGGVITIKAIGGKVHTENQAILQTNATAIGGDGGLLRIQAGGSGSGTPGAPDASSNVELDSSFLEANGPTGDNTNGGVIEIKSFNGSITSGGSTTGHIQALGGPSPGTGSITLEECSSTDSYLGTVSANTIVENRSVCGGNPVVPADAQKLFDANAPIWESCQEFKQPTKSGVKFDDLNGNGVKDAGEPGVQGWTINLLDTGNNVLLQALTDVDGKYTFDVTAPNTYRVCEGTGPAGYVQTYPNANTTTPNLQGEDIINTCPGPNIYGYQFTVQPGVDLTDNDFGNTQQVVCQKQTVKDRMNLVYPKNLGPDTTVRVYSPFNESVQAAVDNVSDTNGDGYLIVMVVAHADGSLGGSANQKVVVAKDYGTVKPFALFGCSVTLTGGGRGAAVSITPTANSKSWTVAGRQTNIFVMDLHGSNSAIGVQADSSNGFTRYLDNECTGTCGQGPNGVGITVIGNNNTVHNGEGTGNTGDGVQVYGNGNLLDTTDATSNGGNGFTIVGNNNQLKMRKAGDTGHGNGGAGVYVNGTGNQLTQITAIGNVGPGFRVTGGTSGSPNAFVKNNKASGQAVAYALNNYVRNTSGGNQADGITVPKTSSPTKCVGTFPAQGATTNFAGTTCP